MYAESRNEVDEAGETITVRFDDDEVRIEDLSSWEQQRSDWVPPELHARSALHFFGLFYDIYSLIEKDGEQLELMIGDGHLSWSTDSGVDGRVLIDHPVLLKRVELRFDAKIPEFTVHETERETELYSGIFVDLQKVSPVAIKNRKGELEAAGYHPLGWDDTEAFLKSLIQTISVMTGEFLTSPSNIASGAPVMWRNPVLFLRKRVAGIATAVDAIVDDIETREVFPSALAQITGTMDEWLGSGIGETQGTQGKDGSEQVFSYKSISDDDILLAKEANAEQLQIVRRLHASGSVIVQGPPGTGKTHTIGNIIGHLLSQGKSILVTAQTAKALRVLRDKVPEVLQPLCVSVLGSDQNARSQLESSVGSITERLTSDTSSTLLSTAQNLEQQRKDVLLKCRELAHKLREALENEYRDLVIGQVRLSPSDAARYVAKHRSEHAWIPGPVKHCASINLLHDELKRLYTLTSLFTATEEEDTRHPLPDLESLPSERQFRSMSNEYEHLLTSDLSSGSDYWRPERTDSQAIERLISSLHQEFSDDLRKQTWRPFAIVAGLHGGTEREVWNTLLANIEKACEAYSKHSMVLHYGPRLSTTVPIRRQQELCFEIVEHLSAGNKVGFVQLATHSEWRQFIKTAVVTSGKPVQPEHFDALRRRAELESARIELEPLWNSLIGQHISTAFSALGDSPELSCKPLMSEIQRCLEWHQSVWLPIASDLKAEGLDLDRLASLLPNAASQISEYTSIEKLAVATLPDMLALEANRRRLRECQAYFEQLALLSTKIDPSAPSKGCVSQIIVASNAHDADSYSTAVDYARRLHSLKPLVSERDALIRKLALVASGWAEMIMYRKSPHDSGQVPDDIETAWTWRQFHDMLEERDRLDADEVQREIDKNRELLRQVTLWLIDSKAWGKQLERLQNDYSVRQALVGWLDTAKRLTSTRQVLRRQSLLSEARKLMKKCADAVPVWIMPISLVAENFDPTTSRFDVVIIDEASQADLNALIPLYMGKQVIVVGDHEQVTPLGVGKDLTLLENLRRSMLQDIPNSHLFDNQSSIYDIGRQSFGDAIRLAEHFRCVPEIIAFSNQLSYDGKIRPLRESNSTHIKPACVSYRVDGIRSGDVNRNEAEAIVGLIKAMTQHDAYAGKTIGVISMVKESQAFLIQSLIHKEIDSVEIEDRRIQAGISSEFQGDERDIILLSMVDSHADEGTMRTTGDGAFELIKKLQRSDESGTRSTWVIHSFDPELHLKSADLRYKLLQHVKDPLSAQRAFNEAEQKTESPFEKEVLRLLTAAGYRVRTQWQVGYFRIDMVVEGAGKRLAVECDGDRYHPIEKLAADVERQTVLERLGWTFIRIRGSAFYRNPNAAMQAVFEKLREMEIAAEGPSSEQPLIDQSLIHELIALMHRNDQPEEYSDEDAEQSVQLDKLMDDFVQENTSHSDVGLFAEPSTEGRIGQVERLLSSLGGVASLEEFLRHYAKAKGHQRLGSLVKRNLKADLNSLRRKGKVAIENGIIRLP